ncbi:TEL2-interacting protein 1 [Polyrhizophydium stewartii]|uniref:TEL2-interacting protein 1 n=1 Tax=Polyrhizophydium stewartii TaxID=2732419 RepID=A0ABR4N4A0_9FUNG
MSWGAWAITRTDEAHPVARLEAAIQRLLERHGADAPDVIAPMLDCVAFPLVEALKSRKASAATVELVCRCLRLVVEPGARSQEYRMPPPLLQHLLFELPLVGSTRVRLPPGVGPIALADAAGAHEDVKLAIVLLLRAVLSAEANVRDRTGACSIDFGALQIQPVLSHNIAMLLDWAAAEKSLEIRLAALESVGAMAGVVADPECIARFMPGIVLCTSKIALQGEKQNHRLVVAALDLLGTVVEATLSDSVSADFCDASASVQDALTRLQASAARETDSSAPQRAARRDTQSENASTMQLSETVRSKSWHETSSSNVSLVLHKIAKARLSHHPATRRAVGNLAARLFRTCSVSLSEALPFMVDTLVLLDADAAENGTAACEPFTQSQISTAALRATATASPETAHRIGDRLATVLEEFLRAVQSGDETQILEAILLSNGYMLILQERSSVALQQSARALVCGIVRLLDFDLEGVRVVEERHASFGAALALMESSPTARLDEQVVFARPTRRFKTFRDPRILAQTRRLCRLAARFGDAEMLVDEFSELLADRAQQAGALFAINEMCLGACGVDFDPPDNAAFTAKGDAARLVHAVVARYLSQPFIEFPTNISDGRLFSKSSASASTSLQSGAISWPSMTVKDMNQTILANSLVLEGLGMMASVLSPEDATFVMIDAMYPILEKLGDRNHAVSDAAAWALQQFAKTCAAPPELQARVQQHALVPAHVPQPTISSLVLSNVDYLIDAVSRRLQHLHMNPLAPKVLTAAIRVTGADLVGPLLSDCIDQLLDVLDDLGTAGLGGGQLLADHVRVDVELLDLSDPGLAGEVLGVFYALIEAMFRSESVLEPIGAARIDKPYHALSSNQETGDVVQMDAALGIPSCSPEIRAYFVQRGQVKGSGDAEPPDEHKSVTAREYFEQRIREKEAARSSAAGLREDGHRRDGDDGDAANNADDEEAADDDDNMQPADRDDPPPTPFELAAKQMLSKAIHFLSSDSPVLRARVIRMMRMGLPLLRARPTDLNPLVHAMWPKLMHRCQDSHHFVVLEAVMTVGAIAAVAPDFVRKRISEDVLPQFVKLLRKLQAGVIASARPAAGARSIGGSAPVAAAVLKKRKQLVEKGVSGVTDRHHISDHLSTSTVENRLFLASLETIELISRTVTLQRHDQDQIAAVLMGFLNTRLYSAAVSDLAERLLVGFVNAGAGDWIWALALIASGSKNLGVPIAAASDLAVTEITPGVLTSFMPFGTPADFASRAQQLLRSYALAL